MSLSGTPANASTCVPYTVFPGSFPNSCLTPVYDTDGNSTTNILSSCCANVNGSAAYISLTGLGSPLFNDTAPDALCYVYCNATTGPAAKALEACLKSDMDQSYSCESEEAVNITTTTTTMSATATATPTTATSAKPSNGAEGRGMAVWTGVLAGAVLLGSVFGL